MLSVRISARPGAVDIEITGGDDFDQFDLYLLVARLEEMVTHRDISQPSFEAPAGTRDGS